jgi:hypothetical protein
MVICLTFDQKVFGILIKSYIKSAYHQIKISSPLKNPGSEGGGGEGGQGHGGEVAQTVYTHMNKCINNKKKKEKSRCYYRQAKWVVKGTLWPIFHLPFLGND